MGKLLEQYLAASLPALQAIVADEPQPKPALPPGVEGIAQSGGATTFPMAEAPPMPMQPIGPGGQPTGPMASMPPAAAATPSFDTPPTPTGAPKPAMPPADAQPQQDRSGEFEKGPDSFAGMAEEADEKDIEKTADAMEASGVDIDAEHAKIVGDTGEGKGKGLSRNEKALILMEFGLSLMASSGSGEGTFAGDLGKAGGAALTGHMGRKAAKKKALTEAEDRKLERELKQAQIDKATRPETVVKTDQQGNMIIVDEQTGESKPVLMDGKPVTAGDADKLDFEVKKEAFKQAYKSTVKDPEELNRRAVAFANSVRQVAFPELARQDQAKAIIKELNEGKNSSQKFNIDGVEKRWKHMTYAEKTAEARKLVDMAMAAAATGVTSSDGAEASFGLSDEQVKGLEPNTKYKLSNDTWVAKRNGKLVEVDPPAQ
jgi:hypothetical protein